MNAEMILSLFAGLVALASVGADYTGYVRLEGEDTSTSKSWAAVGRWSDKKAPSLDKNYYVPPGTLLWHESGNTSAASTKTWGGGQLVIGGTFHTTVNQDPSNGPYVQDLVLLGGSECRVGCFGFLGAANGVPSSVTVEGTMASPAVISHHHVNSSNGSRAYRLKTAFGGSSDSVLALTRPYVNYAGETMDFGWSCEIEPANFATYPGTVVMRGGNFKARPSSNTESYNMPSATLRLEDGANCHFYRNASHIASDAEIGALDSAGGRLYFNCRTSGGVTSVNPVLNIGERLGLNADTVVAIPTNTTPFLVGVTPDNPYGITHRIAHLASSADVVGDLSAVKVDVADNAELGRPVKLLALSNGDGTKDVYLATPGVVAMTNANSSSAGGSGAFDAGNGWMWTNLETPAADSGCTYLTRKTLTFFADANYPDATLSAASSIYSLGGANYSFKTINLCSGGHFRSWGTSVKYRTYTAETFNILASSAAVEVSAGVYLTIDADVCGDGDLEIGNYNNAAGSISLTHANTNFHGRLTIRQSQGTAATLTPRNFSCTLSDSRNWGGESADAENSYRAITLKDFPFIPVQANVAFPASGRGVLVQGGARFNVAAGKTLVFSNQVTYAGILEKNGAGTLELAGTARFLDGQADTAPVGGTNGLNIIAGALKISSKTAADGLAISFAEGTKLIIPSDTEAGYCNTKWSAPLSIDTEDGKLPVEIEPVGIDAPRAVTVPVCTFGSTVADGISPDVFDVSMRMKGMRLLSFERHPNADGTVSYLATIGPSGCCIIFR